MQAKKTVRVGVTTGDLAGCAPELIPPLIEQVDPDIQLVFFGPDSLQKYIEQQQTINTESIEWHSTGDLAPGKISSGEPDSDTGEAAYQALHTAVKEAELDRLDGLLTLPLSKFVIHQAGYERFRGHTAFLEEYWDSDAVMTFFGESMNVSLLTRHCPLDQVANRLHQARIVERIQTTHNFYRDYIDSDPSVAILGLNPHAGEDGILGKEEQTIFAPALKQLSNRGIEVDGPFPADSFFPIHGDRYDHVFACYHDQGLIPFKQHDFFTGVHATLGLPVLRVSPDHGIAAECAGEGTVDHRSTINSLERISSWLRRRSS